MQPAQILRHKLTAISGQDYGACQSLLGSYDFNLFELIIQQIPKDPYAPPHTGIYRIRVRRDDERIVRLETGTRIREIASRDFLARYFYKACGNVSKGIRGTGFSGLITINEPGQAVLERNSVVVDEQHIEIRCFIGIPAQGRSIDSKIASVMLFGELPEIVNRTLLKENIDQDALLRHVQVTEDADTLRKQLDLLGMIAFVADASILPRESGSSDKALPEDSAVPFESPERFMIEIDLPHAGTVRGMGIPGGVTLITGGGYHGKSTLLNALELGIYNHIPGDGREYCVSHPRTVKIRAYSGRPVVKTNISPFIRNLPFQKDTTAFSTENASGSTSQAANIMEAIEAGAGVLLMDEDTCATNFMIRDLKMQQLVQKDDEPITTFIDKVRQLYLDKGISTVLVLGGIGDYFDVADHVIQMIRYQPADVTEKARHISEQSPVRRSAEDEPYPIEAVPRIPIPGSINPFNEYGKFSVYAKEVRRINFGGQVIDLTDLEQLMELSQTKALSFAIEYAKKYMEKDASLYEIIRQVINDIEEKGLDVLTDRVYGNFAAFRGLELAFTINRIRGLEVVQRR